MTELYKSAVGNTRLIVGRVPYSQTISITVENMTAEGYWSQAGAIVLSASEARRLAVSLPRLAALAESAARRV